MAGPAAACRCGRRGENRGGSRPWGYVRAVQAVGGSLVRERLVPVGDGHRQLTGRRLPEWATQLPRCAVVSADGLTARPDGLHFTTEALRTLGLRYLEAYKSLL